MSDEFVLFRQVGGHPPKANEILNLAPFEDEMPELYQVTRVEPAILEVKLNGTPKKGWVVYGKEYKP